jgi:hypothetical protein
MRNTQNYKSIIMNFCTKGESISDYPGWVIHRLPHKIILDF